MAGCRRIREETMTPTTQPSGRDPYLSPEEETPIQRRERLLNLNNPDWPPPEEPAPEEPTAPETVSKAKR
jgi:hypothetical protein